MAATFAYMLALAYAAAFITCNVAVALGAAGSYSGSQSDLVHQRGPGLVLGLHVGRVSFNVPPP